MTAKIVDFNKHRKRKTAPRCSCGAVLKSGTKKCYDCVYEKLMSDAGKLDW